MRSFYAPPCLSYAVLLQHRVQRACNPHWTKEMDQESIGADGMPNSPEPSFVKFPCKAGIVDTQSAVCMMNPVQNF